MSSNRVPPWDPSTRLPPVRGADDLRASRRSMASPYAPAAYAPAPLSTIGEGSPVGPDSPLSEASRDYGLPPVQDISSPSLRLKDYHRQSSRNSMNLVGDWTMESTPSLPPLKGGGKSKSKSKGKRVVAAWERRPRDAATLRREARAAELTLRCFRRLASGTVDHAFLTGSDGAPVLPRTADGGGLVVRYRPDGRRAVLSRAAASPTGLVRYVVDCLKFCSVVHGCGVVHGDLRAERVSVVHPLMSGDGPPFTAFVVSDVFTARRGRDFQSDFDRVAEDVASVAPGGHFASWLCALLRDPAVPTAAGKLRAVAAAVR